MIPLLSLFLTQSPPVELKVDWTAPRVEVSKDLYGIFFEEINCAGDGGIYPELIRNRSFEDSQKLDHWIATPKTGATLDRGAVHLNKGTSLTNFGFYGMHIVPTAPYEVTVRYSCDQDTTFTFLAVGDEIMESKTVVAKAAKEGTLRFEYKANRLKGRKEPKTYISISADDDITLDFVSVFPKRTFNNRANGLRPDLMKMLADLKPAFLRFPGGCWVEGDTMAFAQRWKTTIGDLHLRKTLPNLWGYTSTNGLGYHEYLQMCEDLKAAPMFVVNCGMSHREVVPMDKMDEFVQDALDAIEYANGPITSFWGAKRAAAGHPKSFNLKYLEIGNENGGTAYEERYGLMYRAIKKKYPEIELIANDWFGRPKNTPIDIIDEHYYNSPSFFFRNENKYDRYDRKGSQVYVGEYAVTQGCGTGNLIAALGESAFMLGMERNSDIVKMASYAPLFANVANKAWNPDLIYFDAKSAYATPSYHVQQLLAANKPTQMLKTKLSHSNEEVVPFPSGGFALGTWNTQAEFKDVEINSSKDINEPKSVLKNSGTWQEKAGMYQQTSNNEPAVYHLPAIPSERGTFRLKARKTSGAEGFLVSVGNRADGSYVWLNLGGWQNKQHGLEYSDKGSKSDVGRRVAGTIETGRWYQIEIQYSPDRIICLLDGKQIFNEKPNAAPTVFANLGEDTKSGEYILKLVSGSRSNANFRLPVDFGTTGLEVKSTTLTHSNPLAENSMANPNNVAPKTSKVRLAGKNPTLTLPAYSLTILRIPMNRTKIGS